MSGKDDPLLVTPWELPEPQHAIAVEAATRGDEDKLGGALQRLAAEDPTVRIERQQETGQLVLWCVGEAHAEVLLDRLRTPLLASRSTRSRSRSRCGRRWPARSLWPAGT